MKKLILPILLSLFFLWGSLEQVTAAVCGDPLPNPPDKNFDYTAYMNDCGGKINDLSSKIKTYEETVTYYRTQISLTQAKIASTEIQLSKLEQEIIDLSGKIDSIDYSLTDLTKLFVARVRETYMRRNNTSIALIAQSYGIPHVIRSLEYGKQVRDHDREILIMLEKSRLDYDSQKQIKEAKQKEVEKLQKKLESERSQLAKQKQEQERFLAETKNNKAKFEQLRASARAQLAAFSKFVTNQGGASILSGTTKTDPGWGTSGTYYNQREDDWGNIVINNQNNCGNNSNEPCTMASVGCLVTSMAMVMSYYGKSVTPGDIAMQSELFSFADFRQGSLSISGVNTTRTRIGYSRSSLDNELAANPGKPVIVGIIQYGSSRPEHFFVVKAKDGDDYIINDPFPGNGYNTRLSSHYSVNSIAAVDRVIVQ